MLWKKYSLVRGYLHYWLHAVNEHSLHAPWVYRLYCNTIKRDVHHSIFEEIELIRQSLLKCDDPITVEQLGAPSLVTRTSTRKISSIARHGLTSPKFSRLLYRIAAEQAGHHILELGTSLGVNTLYLSSARPSAQVYTLEGVSAIAERAERAFRPYANIQLVRGNIDQTLPEVLAPLPSVDLAYLDANHRYEPTVRYFEQIITKTRENSVVVVDDIYWSREMQQAWQYIKQHPSVTLSIDLFDAGLVFFLPLQVRQDYILMF